MPSQKSLSQLVRDWRKSADQVQRVRQLLPRIIGNECLQVVRDNFRLQAYDTGQGRTKWEKRKDSTNKRYDSRKGVKGATFNSGNKILRQTGNLYDAITYRVTGQSVRIGVDDNIIKYAKIHNEGGQGNAFGKHKFTMPKRQFMPTDAEGPNKKMLGRITSKIAFEIDKALKPFKK